MTPDAISEVSRAISAVAYLTLALHLGVTVYRNHLGGRAIRWLLVAMCAKFTADGVDLIVRTMQWVYHNNTGHMLHVEPWLLAGLGLANAITIVWVLLAWRRVPPYLRGARRTDRDSGQDVKVGGTD